MYACMYCMFVCMYACMYCMFVCMHVCMYVLHLPNETESGVSEVFGRNRHGHRVDDSLRQPLHIQLGGVVFILVILHACMHAYIHTCIVCIIACTLTYLIENSGIFFGERKQRSSGWAIFIRYHLHQNHYIHTYIHTYMLACIHTHTYIQNTYPE